MSLSLSLSLYLSLSFGQFHFEQPYRYHGLPIQGANMFDAFGIRYGVFCMSNGVFLYFGWCFENWDAVCGAGGQFDLGQPYRHHGIAFVFVSVFVYVFGMEYLVFSIGGSLTLGSLTATMASSAQRSLSRPCLIRSDIILSLSGRTSISATCSTFREVFKGCGHISISPSLHGFSLQLGNAEQSGASEETTSQFTKFTKKIFSTWSTV